jgi:hypothetical protein
MKLPHGCYFKPVVYACGSLLHTFLVTRSLLKLTIKSILYFNLGKRRKNIAKSCKKLQKIAKKCKKLQILLQKSEGKRVSPILLLLFIKVFNLHFFETFSMVLKSASNSAFLGKLTEFFQTELERPYTNFGNFEAKFAQNGSKQAKNL